jgi:hypothetical protein
MKCKKPKQPENNQDRSDYPKHVFISCAPVKTGEV